MTREKIGDPVEFFQADKQLKRGVLAAGRLTISGPDLDVEAYATSGWYDSTFVTNSSIHPTLGNLYPRGDAAGVPGWSDTSIHLTWFPSPMATNHLSERLGNRPGQDVLKVVHSEGANIGSATYVEHLKRGEFPQSTEPGYFFVHDRDDDHIPGLLLLPPQARLGIQRCAQQGSYKNKILGGNPASGLARAVDVITAVQGNIARTLTLSFRDPETADPSSVPWHYLYQLENIGADLLLLGHRLRPKKALSSLIFNHFCNMQDRIKKL